MPHVAVEPHEARVIVEEAAEITLDEETTEAIRDHALTRLGEALSNLDHRVAMGTDTHEDAKKLLWAVDQVKRYAEVIYWLTPAPLEDQEPA